MRPGDFVIVNDVIGCVKKINPLTVLCQDGVVRALNAEAHVIITGQHYALLLAEKALRRIRDGNSTTV